MECPHCKLLNPDGAERCDCGYDFKSGSLETSYNTETSETGGNWLDIQLAGMPWGGVALCCICTCGLPLALVAAIACRHPEARKKALIILGVNLGLCCLGLLAKFGKSLF